MTRNGADEQEVFTMKYAMKQEKIIFNLCLSEIQGNENDKFNEHISSDRNLNHAIFQKSYN